MKIMYKVYQWSTDIEEVQVLKDTGKTITYEVPKFTIGKDSSSETVKRKEAKQTDWYSYCDTVSEAKAWLLLCATNTRAETFAELERQDAAIAEIKKIKIY